MHEWLLFQAVRELLFSVVKHAGVSQARVELHRQEQQVQLIVCDQGAGFDPSQPASHVSAAAGLGLFIHGLIFAAADPILLKIRPDDATLH